MKQRAVADLSELPTYGFGSRSPIWWGTLGFVALEGMAFVLAAGAYLYLAWSNADWPQDRAPDLLAGTALLAVLILSLLPTLWLAKAARIEDRRKVRMGLLLASAFGILAIAIRCYELTTLNTRWDTNVFGSMQWLLIGLHTTHLVTDVGDTLVLTALMFTRHAEGKRFSDVSDNCFYWYFVVVSWAPIYGLVYWAARL